MANWTGQYSVGARPGLLVPTSVCDSRPRAAHYLGLHKWCDTQGLACYHSTACHYVVFMSVDCVSFKYTISKFTLGFYC